jgi:flagellar biosynthesis protein FlhA
MAEALRPMLAPQLLQQIAPLKEALPLAVLTPDLEEMLMRSNREEAGLVVDQGLAQRLVGGINDAMEALAGQGRQGIVVVSAGLRRAFAAFLRSHGSDAIVLGVNELPENRRIEIVATLGGNNGAA